MRRARRRSRPSRPWSPHRVSRQSPRARCLPPFLEIVAGGEDLLDVLLLLVGVAHERPHVDDPLALLAGDLGPVVGVVVFGRSSFSLNSSRTALSRSPALIPFSPPPISRLRASFLARRTTDSIMAPEEKSLK